MIMQAEVKRAEVVMDYEDFERMKNCVNCIHSEVCLIVAKRKACKANDYSACSKWKLIEGAND